MKRVCEAFIIDNKTVKKPQIVKKKVSKQTKVEVKCSKCECETEGKNQDYLENPELQMSNSLTSLLNLPNSNDFLSEYEDSDKFTQVKNNYTNDHISLKCEYLYNKII